MCQEKSSGPGKIFTAVRFQDSGVAQARCLCALSRKKNEEYTGCEPVLRVPVAAVAEESQETKVSECLDLLANFVANVAE